MEDVASWFKQPYVGSVETAIAPFWRLLQTQRFSGRILLVRRNSADVARSLFGLGWRGSESLILRLDHKLNQIAKRLPGVRQISYEDLGTELGARAVWEHVLGIPFDEPWYNMYARANLQVNFPAMERYANAYAPQLARMASLAKQACLRDMVTERERTALVGITIAEEPFETFLRDGAGLFAQHAYVVGEPEGSWEGKNIPFLREIASVGRLQVITARSNGRMFGYLMSELTPSRENASRLSAVETTFFVSPDMPGLGMRLQRETLRALRGRGVSEVWFREGDRASGPRLGALYRRFGAAPAGALFRLEL